MSTTRGLLAGVLGLSLLELIVSDPKSANNAGGLFTLATSAIRRIVDPSVPLVPDLRNGSSTTASTAAPATTLPSSVKHHVTIQPGTGGAGQAHARAD